MSLPRGAMPSMPHANSSCQLCPDWSFALAAAWQVASALDVRSRRSDLLVALDALVTLPVTPTTSVVERGLLRGYLLELARGLRAARLAVRAGLTAELDAFCGLLEVPTAATRQLLRPARALIMEIRDGDRLLAMNTAEQARTLIDESGNMKVTAATLARMLGQNARSVDRAFRRSFGKSIATYRREREAQAGLDAILKGVPLKRAVDFAGCSESTLRRRIRALTGRTPKGWKGRYPMQVSPAQNV